MTSQPVHDRLDRSPTWTIQGVFDPDKTGQDFSYTIGLHELGLPELHLWASPTDGPDPGDGWAFSHRDRTAILNQLASRMVDGRLAPGSTVVEKFDQGHVSVTFQIGTPGDREALEALGIAPGAEVLPVHWSLEREPIGPSLPMSPAARQAAFDEYASVVRSLPPRRAAAPEGWQLTPIPDFGADERFGPRTPVVLARAAQLWSSADLRPWIGESLPFASMGSLMWPATVSHALARPAGRTQALQELEREAERLVEHVVVGRSGEWRRAAHAIGKRHGFEPDEWDRLAETAHHALAEMTMSVLCVEAVADLAGQDLLLAARGPWIAACDPGCALPGPAWSAGPNVVRAVRRVLRPLALHEWSAIVHAHDEAHAGEAYAELSWELRQRYFTQAAGMPWRKLADLPAGREVKHLVRRGQDWPLMVEWASCLSALLTHRPAYSAEQVATFVAPVRHLLPDLERVVNAL